MRKPVFTGKLYTTQMRIPETIAVLLNYIRLKLSYNKLKTLTLTETLVYIIADHYLSNLEKYRDFLEHDEVLKLYNEIKSKIGGDGVEN